MMLIRKGNKKKNLFTKYYSRKDIDFMQKEENWNYQIHDPSAPCSIQAMFSVTFTNYLRKKSSFLIFDMNSAVHL